MDGSRHWVCVFLLCGFPALAAADEPKREQWALKPLLRPEPPAGVTDSPNPIDAFIAAELKAKGLTPLGPADRRTLLRRLSLDLIGIPPTPAEQDAFLKDDSPQAYEKVVDRLLASEQHGVRYARRWLDVLRYADQDERMIAAPGIHLWRDWVINALNSDMPYDQFVRAQLTGQRSMVRTQMAAIGVRSRLEPRPDDLFALGFLARGAVIRDNKDSGELAILAVETISTAFMGMTVGCAKCHDHLYDPISQRDFYAMKALFDPLVVKKVLLGTSADMIAQGKVLDEIARKREAIEGPLNDLVAPYKQKLYDERVLMLPADVQPIIRKSEKERTAAEQKIADDYFPILRIDADKFLAIMPAAERTRYQELQKKLGQAGGKGATAIPAFWTVEVDRKKEAEKSYILTSGDPERPELNHEVQPGWPFAPAKIEFREGRVEAFSDWLTAADNPLFARVAVNRLWQWHFGEGLHKSPSDFGSLGGSPTHPRLLDWLASEFAKRNFRMKEMHKLIVTSEAYKRASADNDVVAKRNHKTDPNNAFLWRFRLQRLDAEPIWDSIFSAAGNLDLAVGGPSFDPEGGGGKRGGGSVRGGGNRRAAYMSRGYSTSRDAVPAFLQTFDVEDGRLPCPLRTQTVTPPQALFMMNSDVVDKAAARFAERIAKQAGGDLSAAVDLAYRTAIARPPSAAEREQALAYLSDDADRLKGLAWLLFNLDEFIYVR
jgi:hypothetical protein